MALSVNDKLQLLRTMLTSRAGDLREQSLIRQGKGWFHVSGMGHEALAALGRQLRDGDYLAGYYRDRPLALARGLHNLDLARAFFAKSTSASGGRQMPAHYSNKELGIFSVASVVGASLLPACGFAWGLQLDGRDGVVLTTVGDAATREGEFYEAVAFAIERKLPVLFLVEDNGIGISSVTGSINPLALGVLDASRWQSIDACSVDAVDAAGAQAIAAIRSGAGPQFLWCRTERISSHSSADDHRKYRSAEELEQLSLKDPINRFKAQLIAEGVLDESGYEALLAEVEASVRADYQSAASEPDPDPATLMQHVHGAPATAPQLRMDLQSNARMVDAINKVFATALTKEEDFVFFGQDIEDPKGGVFSITKGLSTKHAERVCNSPLAEATIVGVACGLAAYGKRPVFEIQFADFIWPAFNQLMTNLSTLHWRSNGEWAAPAVLYAPYGAYLPGGSLWHSQANEAALAHFPGLHIVIPSTPEDAAGLFWSAMHSNTPCIVLIPKHLMWQNAAAGGSLQPVPLGKAAVRRSGRDVTLVSWGNCMEVVSHALDAMPGVSADLLDVRSIVPLDFAAIEQSVRKTGRLVVVQEDAETCSVGQHIIARLLQTEDIWNGLRAAPVLVAKPDVNIGYHPNFEYAALPDKDRVIAAVRKVLAHSTQRTPVDGMTCPAGQIAQRSGAVETVISEKREIRVPILGEGISSARVVSLIAKEGDAIEEDDPLCEVETDKALFPIESHVAGRLKEWLIAEGDEVEVEQLIAVLEVEGVSVESASSAVPSMSKGRREVDVAAAPAPRVSTRPTDGGLSPHIIAQMRNAVPAHMTVKADWGPIRSARAAAKQKFGSNAPSPTVMVAWCVVQAMKKHPVFTCTIAPTDTLIQHDDFDFGVAVSLANDALDTAVIECANQLDWEGFIEAYDQAVRKVRSGVPSSKACTPLILTSMGGFNVRDAAPVVVPPAIGTLFIGEAHWDLDAKGTPVEKVNLCLTFDHRWLNGVAGAQFLSDVRAALQLEDVL